MHTIKIISDGTAQGTRILDADGKEIRGVTRLEIEPLDARASVRARLTFEVVQLDVTAVVSGNAGSSEQNQLGVEIARQIEMIIDSRIARAAGPRGMLRTE